MTNTATLPNPKLIDVQSHEDRVARSNRRQGYAEGLVDAAATVIRIQDDEAGRKIRRAILDLIKVERP